MNETNSSPSLHALEKYTPESASKRSGLALCLSGGGYRAILFHLGALRRLNELNILSRVNTITSVSGGSIIAGFLATRIKWPLSKPVDDWNSLVTFPVRSFTKRNIRTPAILRRFFPWRWFKEDSGVQALAEEYERWMPLGIAQLPSTPSFVFCATDMAVGVNWIFSKMLIGDYQVGYITPKQERVSTAVAASSCFPPIFNPMRVRDRLNEFKDGKIPEGEARQKYLSDLPLTDGGNYDNLGLEPVWKTHQILLVSDGGGTLDFESDKNLLWRVQRYSSILENQVSALRKRWLISGYIRKELQGTYWGIGSAASSYDPQTRVGYSKELASTCLSKIRTDLDAFSDAEAAVLENHGYILADTAIKKHARALLPEIVPPLLPPYIEWMEEEKVGKALKHSSKRKIFGRWKS